MSMVITPCPLLQGRPTTSIGKVEEFNASARAGAVVQVDATTLQVAPAMLSGLGPWVCALLIDRKQDLMQVRVGS
jgi:hypothetical protein